MALRLEAVTFEVADAAAVAAFWAGLLDREVLAEPDGALVPGDRRAGRALASSPPTPSRSARDVCICT